MIRATVRGSFKDTEAFLGRMKLRAYLDQLEKYGQIGVEALRKATPVDSAQTAESWSYEIVSRPGYFAIHWYNSHVEEPGTVPVAVLIQYGHATGNGGRVEGLDFINPAMQPIFQQMADEMWKEVTK